MNLIKEAIWAGAINTRVIYGSYEYLLKVHRSAYLPLYYRDIVHFFSILSLTPQLELTPVWLTLNETPLKWNIPIGVLHDIFNLPQSETSSIWTLTLVASSDQPYPSDTILPFPSPIMGESVNYEDTVFQLIINQLKQSCYVLGGNSRAILSMSEDDTRALWKAVQTHDYDKYHSSTRAIIPTSETIRKIPIKLYPSGSHFMHQLSVAPTKEDGSFVSLGEALSDQKKSNPYVHGIKAEAMLEMELIQVWKLFRHLDNFLYVILV